MATEDTMLDISKGKYWSKALSLVDGCSPISEACLNCWLATTNHRFGKKYHDNAINFYGKFRTQFTDAQGKWNGKIQFREDRLAIPQRIKKPQVFAIWSDLYHSAITDEQIIQSYNVMLCHPEHIFLVLTKRIERVASLFPQINNMLIGRLNHVWHGCTVETQQRANERISYLLQVPENKFLSLEPLLSEIDLSKYLKPHWWECPKCESWSILEPTYPAICDCDFPPNKWIQQRDISQVIVGAESGSYRRPCKIEWIESIIQQCKDAKVSVFVKQIHDKHGKVIKDINKFPEDLKRRELAWQS